MRRGLALAGIAAVLPWPTAVVLSTSVAQAASVTGASFTGGAGTRIVNGNLFADPGAAVTLNVTTDNTTRCIEITGAHTVTKTGAAGTTQWSVPLTANLTNGVHTVTATAFRSFNNQNKCTANAGEGLGIQTASYTVESDSTAPVVKATLSTAANAAGWHKTPVDISWSATDFGSGVAAGYPSPATDSVAAETPATGVTKASIAKDNAGNTGTGTVTVRLDKTAPTVTASADRAANDAGWYRDDVSVSFQASDALSGIDKAPAAKVLGEGAGQSAAGTAVDVAGNEAGATLSGINVDKTAPTLGAAVESSPNTAGWYSGPVTVKWTAADALSGLAAPAPADTVFSTEGANQSVTETVGDKAGNTTSASSPAISIDATAPNTSAVAPSGWTATDQTVTLDAHDGLSGVKATFYKLDGDAAKIGTDVAIAGNGTHTLEYWSVDDAGNEETHKSVEVNIDGSSPTISHSLTPAANAAGWNNSDVTVTFECADTLSGIASCTADRVVADEGAAQVVTGTATDNAGNTATDPALVNLDETAPTVKGSTDRPANAEGWYKDDVTVSFLAGDALSGIDTFSAPKTLGEGENQSAKGTATDVAGNVGDDTVADIDVDKTAPSLSGAATSDPNPAGWYDGDVTVHWTASDALSGLAAAPADETITGEGDDLSASATVADKAGNETVKTVGGIKIDRAAPTTTVDVTRLPDSGWYTGDVSVTLHRADGLSGVAKTYYKVDGGTTQEYTDTFSHGLNGKHQIAFWSVDKAGNTEDANSIEVRIDGVAPDIDGSRTPAANGFGWNNSDVVVSFKCSDADSGIADCSAPTKLENEGAGQEVEGQALDVAGNTAATTVGGISIDKTAPALEGAATTNPNGAGWYKGDVTVAWTADDGLSGIDSGTVPANSIVTGEGDDLGTAEVSVADKAGNVTKASKGSFKIDRTGPVISGGATTQPNAAGWYSGEVTMAFTCTDNLSGMASCPDKKVLSGNGAAQSATSEPAEDLAGNTTPGKTVGGINIDGLAPQTTADNQCTKTNGWCTGATANVVLTSTDQTGLSGVKEIHYSVNGGAEQVAAGATKTVSVPLDGSGNATVRFYAVDKAGNVEDANEVGLKYDNIAPTVTHTVTPAPNADEWNNSDVKVHFDVKDDDAGSGVDASKTTPDENLSAETPFAGLDILGEAFDLAGNKGTDKVTVKLDRTAPTIEGEVISGQLGNDGWYTGPVTVHFKCSDALSGVKVCPKDEIVNSNGAAQKATGEAIDAAGNKASATVSVDIDQVKPTVDVGGVDKALYTLGVQPSPTCSASDDHSGLAAPCTVSTAGGNANGVGEYTVTATATDKAGNTATDTVKYRVTYKWDGFRQPITATAHDQGAVSVFKAGSTIPVKYQLRKADGTVVQGTPGSWITPVKGAVTFAPLTDDGTSVAADSGSLFRWDSTDRQWIYNWGTAKSDANKQFTIGVRLDDGQVYSAVIGLR